MVWDSVTSHMAGPPRGTQFLQESDRGVSTVVGFVMIVALLVITLSIYQSDVVPNQNAEIEHQYSQSLDGEFADLRSTVDDVATSGAPASTTIQGGPEYPSRALAINGPEPAGRLRTTNESNMTLEGLQSDGGGYWNDIEREFSTRLLEFQPRYNFLQLDERYYLENGVGVKVVEDGAYTTALDGDVVEGDRIDVVLLAGKVDAQDRVHDLALEPISTGSDFVTVEPTGPESTLTLPTARSEAAWNETADKSPNVNETRFTCRRTGAGGDPPCESRINDVTLVLNQSADSYDLRVTKLGFEGAPKPEAEYLTTTATVRSGLSMDRTHEFEVTARDRFGNPADAEIELVGGGGGTFLPGTSVRTTGGKATFQYQPHNGNAANFKVQINKGKPSYQRLEFSLGAATPGGGGRVFEVYNDGQLYEGFGEIDSIELSDLYAGTTTEEHCLLIDGDEGLLGGLLGGLTCLDTEKDVTRFTADVRTEGPDYELTFELMDQDQSGHLGEGNIFEADDYAAVRIDTESSEISDPVFQGTLKPERVNPLFVNKSGSIELLDSNSYKDVEWGSGVVCTNRNFLGICTNWEERSDVDSFDEVFEDPVQSVYIHEADGHTTVEMSP